MKKKFVIIGIILATIILAVVSVLTAIRIREMGTRPVAPSVPESMPGAIGGLPENPSVACSLTFSVKAVIPTLTLTPIPTKEPGCDSVCNATTKCSTGLTCSNGHCRKPACLTEKSCTCPKPTATPTLTPTPIPSCNNTCTDNKVCPSGLECVNGNCRNLSCITIKDCNCPNPVCNDTCTIKSDCPSDLDCIAGHCRMTDCKDETDCTCPVAGTSYCDYLYAGPSGGEGPLTVEFAGKGYDTARVKGFRFTFGDGENKEVLGSYVSSHIETISHTYAQNGIYKAVLEILDDGDHWRTRSECEQTITVTGEKTYTTPIPTKAKTPTSTPTRKVTATKVPTLVPGEPTPTDVLLPVAGIKVPTMLGIVAGFLLISLGAAMVF